MNEAAKEATPADLLQEMQMMNRNIQTLSSGIDASSRTMQSGLRMVYLVPMAVVFFGVSTWLLTTGKISEYTWGAVFACLASPFFGEGFRNALAGKGVNVKNSIDRAEKAGIIVGILCLIASLI